MKGDIYLDFAVAIVLFTFAFVSTFYYFDSQINLKLECENLKISNLKIESLLNNLERYPIEERIILVSGFARNEFVNLSEYDIDLILDESGDNVCFDSKLEGFLTNESYGKYYLYSVPFTIDRDNCDINSFSDSLVEEISSPIYKTAYLNYEKELINGTFCTYESLPTFSESGFLFEKIKICI